MPGISLLAQMRICAGKQLLSTEHMKSNATVKHEWIWGNTKKEN